MRAGQVGHRTQLPFIPKDDWRRDAACASRMHERLWDDRLDDIEESDLRREERHNRAKAVCRNECEVRLQCGQGVDWRYDDGIRAGHKLPPLDAQKTEADARVLERLRRGLPLDVAAA